MYANPNRIKDAEREIIMKKYIWLLLFLTLPSHGHYPIMERTKDLTSQFANFSKKALTKFGMSITPTTLFPKSMPRCFSMLFNSLSMRNTENHKNINLQKISENLGVMGFLHSSLNYLKNPYLIAYSLGNFGIGYLAKLFTSTPEHENLTKRLGTTEKQLECSAQKQNSLLQENKNLQQKYDRVHSKYKVLCKENTKLQTNYDVLSNNYELLQEKNRQLDEKIMLREKIINNWKQIKNCV